MKPILVFQTDFTYAEGAVSSMYGVVSELDTTIDYLEALRKMRRLSDRIENA